MAGNGKEYLVIANEGDDKEYEWDNKAVWTEMVRGKVSNPPSLPSLVRHPPFRGTSLISIVVISLHSLSCTSTDCLASAQLTCATVSRQHG